MPSPLIWGGLAIGLALGAVLERSRFCMVAALSNFVLMRDLRHLHAYLAALAVAIAGTAWLETTGLVAIAESGYRAARLDWVGAVAGGLLFGFGALLAGGCAGRTLVNAATGNLGSLLALAVFASAGWAAQFGPLEPLRVQLASATAWNLPLADGSIAAALGTGTVPTAALCALLALIAAARAISDWRMIIAGAAIGLLIVAGWWITGDAGAFDPAAARPDSVSYSGPLARVVQGALSGQIPGSAFGPALLAGTMIGAAASSLVSRSFRWTLPASGRIGALSLGGLMMGLGGSLAAGCNIGHGITGLATLSIKSLIASLAIVAGMRAGLAWLARRDVLGSLACPPPSYGSLSFLTRCSPIYCRTKSTAA